MNGTSVPRQTAYITSQWCIEIVFFWRSSLALIATSSSCPPPSKFAFLGIHRCFCHLNCSSSLLSCFNFCSHRCQVSPRDIYCCSGHLLLLETLSAVQMHYNNVALNRGIVPKLSTPLIRSNRQLVSTS